MFVSSFLRQAWWRQLLGVWWGWDWEGPAMWGGEMSFCQTKRSDLSSWTQFNLSFSRSTPPNPLLRSPPWQNVKIKPEIWVVIFAQTSMRSSIISMETYVRKTFGGQTISWVVAANPSNSEIFKSIIFEHLPRMTFSVRLSIEPEIRRRFWKPASQQRRSSTWSRWHRRQKPGHFNCVQGTYWRRFFECRSICCWTWTYLCSPTVSCIRVSGNVIFFLHK